MRFSALILSLMVAAGPLSAQIATQTVNDAYFGFHAGTNRLQPSGFPLLRGSSFSWHLDNPGGEQVHIYSNEVLHASFDEPAGSGGCNIARAWSVQSHASNIIVAIVDDTFDLSHPDLAGRWWINPGTGVPGIMINGGAESTNVNIATTAHGTSAAGIIAAIGNNSVGVAGVCKDGVQIMPIASAGTTDDRARGVLWAATNGARVILFAYGTTSQRASWTNAFMVAQARGCLVVNAVIEDAVNPIGHPTNSFPTRDYPCMWGRYDTNIIPKLTNLLTVTCARQDEVRYSPGGWSSDYVDAIYPGRRIPSTTYTNDSTNGYAAFNGTSPAAAIAAGHAALLWQRYRHESFWEIKERILANVTTNAAYATNCASGMPDVFRSMIWVRPQNTSRRIRMSAVKGIETSTDLRAWSFYTQANAVVELPVGGEPQRFWRPL